jgi:hypothetical protein
LSAILSVGDGIVEHVFDSEFASVSDAELVAAIEDGARREAIEAARQLAAIAELVHRAAGDDDERARWAFDPWDSVAAQVASALNIGHRRASGRMRIAQALRDRLPKVAALHLKGELCFRVVSAITWGTRLVLDEDALAMIDTAIADKSTRLGPLSEDRLRAAVDVLVHRYDPDAVRRTEGRVRGRDFVAGTFDDDVETAAIWGRLLATDAAALDKRVTAMANGVCDADPRSIGERRADALGALGNGQQHLACACGSPTCPVTGDQPAPKSNVVIHVIADQQAVEAARGSTPTTGAVPRPAPPALLVGRGVLPNPLLAAVISNGATIKPMARPGAEPEPRYRPSAELAEFVRLRDLFCRFPGCTEPADRCDLDHVQPWPWGPTHASNLNCKCRKHHLMKTFCGWHDVQLPDATVIWTSPDGRTSTTKPGALLIFPQWDVTTAQLPPPITRPPDAADRGLMMPRRQRTRAADDAARVRAERALNQLDVPAF